VSSQILSLKDDIRRKDTSAAMELLRLKRMVEEKDAQVQNLQGIREALDDANSKVCLSKHSDLLSLW
jgi:hypothetical protein